MTVSYLQAAAIEIDGQGNIYISDIHSIQVFSQDRRNLDKIKIKGDIFDLAFDFAGSLWRLSNQSKLYKYQINGG